MARSAHTEPTTVPPAPSRQETLPAASSWRSAQTPLPPASTASSPNPTRHPPRQHYTTITAAGFCRGSLTAEIWPALDYSRVPYRLYHDAELYAREQERSFGGPVWSFLGLQAEIPKPGDFRASYVGETPIIFNRDETGAVKAFVNRCAHRGAQVRRELSGNAANHICLYHQWCYGLDGGLTAIPFRRGVRGKGGLDPSFDMGRHGLQRLRVASMNGAIFGTLAEDAEPLEAYLGAPILTELGRILHKPVRVLG